MRSGIKSNIKLKTVNTKNNTTKTAVHQINEPKAADEIEQPKMVDKSMNKGVGVVLPPKEREN